MIASRASASQLVPQLRNGDRLSSEEFCRRWEASPGVKRAELLEGQVYIHPPRSAGTHGIPHAQMASWLGHYGTSAKGFEAFATSSIYLGLRDLPLSDAILRVKDQYGGTSQMKRTELYGAPELIIGVAASSATYDLFVKKDRYAAHGVQEYLVWIVHERKFAWWTLESDEYVPLEQERNGVIKSLVFPGLWLDTKGMLSDNWSKTLATLQNGLASPEYHQVVKSLAARGRRKRKP